MKIKCAAIVHYADGVVLVRDTGATEWRLPERELNESEDIMLCARRCVLAETGYRALAVRFFRIQARPRTPKQGPVIRFVVGCEIGPGPLQTPNQEAACFTPQQVVKLADQKKFDDPLLLNLILKYQQAISAWPNR